MRSLTIALCAVLLLTGCGGPSKQEVAKKHAQAVAAQKRAQHEAEAAALQAKKKALVARCATDSQHTRAVLHDINARLNSGLSYSEYTRRAGNAESAFDADLRQYGVDAKAKTAPATCLRVFSPLATEVDLHAATAKLWGACIDDFSCDIDKGTTHDKMQKNWLRAANLSSRADTALTNLNPTP